MAISGVGVGLRSSHIKSVLESQCNVQWFELLSDNWFDATGIDGVLLDEFCGRYPVSLHSIGMNVGGCDPINEGYIKKIKDLANRVGSQNISDHLCFSQVDHQPIHDLGPIPYNNETLQHVVDRIITIQESLGVHISIENISAYIHCLDSTMTEASFLNLVAKKTGCKILLDINNLYVNTKNLGRSAESYIHEIHPDYVSQYHLAGFNDQGDYLLDAHDQRIHDDVLTLYRLALLNIGLRPTLIEWDHNVPSFNEILNEYDRVKKVYQSVEKDELFMFDKQVALNA